MVKLFPFIFILLWSSAFITTKPIIDNSDPFSALSFRFFIVALVFFIFSILTKKKIIGQKKHLIHSIFSGVLFHGFYLGGVFFSISKGLQTGIAAFQLYATTKNQTKTDKLIKNIRERRVLLFIKNNFNLIKPKKISNPKNNKKNLVICGINNAFFS